MMHSVTTKNVFLCCKIRRIITATTNVENFPRPVRLHFLFHSVMDHFKVTFSARLSAKCHTRTADDEIQYRDLMGPDGAKQL